MHSFKISPIIALIISYTTKKINDYLRFSAYCQNFHKYFCNICLLFPRNLLLGNLTSIFLQKYAAKKRKGKLSQLNFPLFLSG